MAYFLNKNFENNEFELRLAGKYFIDKTRFIKDINKLVRTGDRYVCITKPRRFGKTTNAMMLASYYSKGADFKELFDKLEISKEESYLKHLNKHNVIYIAFNKPVLQYKNYDEYIESFKQQLIDDLIEKEGIEVKEKETLGKIFNDVYNKTKEGFIFIIDEWDYIFNHNLFTEEEKKNFLEFLEDLLKDQPYVELAYMTGVLPIAKYSSGSALNMFREYTFLNDIKYDKYFGFTNEEVEELCKKQNKVTMKELKEWYNGYKTLNGYKLYNPRSVVYALDDGACQNYWTDTGPMNEVIYYIKNNIEEVREDIVQMVSGIPVEIRLKGYGAEKVQLNTRNQILSAMTVYGFLSYYDETLMIPNKELRIKFD